MLGIVSDTSVMAKTGQGINSGLQDVVALDQALQGKKLGCGPFADKMAHYE